MSGEHREALVKLVQEQGWTRGAELGVDKGILFHMLLDSVPGLRLTGVDTFPNRERSRRAFETADRHPNAQLLCMTTEDAASVIPDGSLDFVFIDADHGEAAVSIDIARWAPKVRAGGWVGGHDYHRKFPGVIAAVDRVYGTRVKTWPGAIWGVWQ